MTDGDKAMDAAEAAVKAGSPELAGAILAAEALGMDIKGPHIIEAAAHANAMFEWGKEIGEKRAESAGRNGKVKRG